MDKEQEIRVAEEPEQAASAIAPRPWHLRLAPFAEEVEKVISPLLKLLLVITVFLGGYEYLQRQQSARVEKSLALVDEWKTGGHRDAYQRINDLIWPLYAPGADAIRDLKPDAAERALIFANLGETVTGGDDDFTAPADRDVDLVFYFFERAALCANERICDYGVLHTFLGQEAESFWLYFSRYAERRQAVGYSQYGVWTERFASGDIRQGWFFGLL